ncbi:hypothetical protein [Verrucomicrobium sp. BvORR034]|uniref:hypothetical protein n=1 Tax=Verrucomicrobium sp. BvORR034 TaxID=1396418 RepID=UPI0006788E3E|nr:hypothetical protein [Verrucomicrobium sp. BvORR034]
MTRDLQTLRGKIFFWLGIVVLPVFWIFWMNSRQFARHQIRAAQIWTGIYAAALIGIPAAYDRVHAFLWAFSQISFQVGLVLWVWLFLRTMSIGTFVLFFLVSIDIIAIMSSLIVPWLAKLAPHPSSLVFILLPAAMHLLVEPVRGSNHQTARHRA